MTISTLLNFTRSVSGVWKLGQETDVGGLFCFVFLFSRLRCIAVDAKCGLCDFVPSLCLREK